MNVTNMQHFPLASSYSVPRLQLHRQLLRTMPGMCVACSIGIG